MELSAWHTLGPHRFLTVWLDGQPAQATADAFHSSFRIAPAGGSLALTFPIGSKPAVLDYIDYETLGADRSIGLFPDGQFGSRQLFYFPTPGAPNTNSVPPVPLFINEWMAANTTSIVNPATGQFDDWFELFNPNDVAADLTGYSLGNDLTSSAGRWTVPPGSRILPHDFLLVWADSAAAQANPVGNDLHAPFKLSKAGEAIGLFAPNGFMVDSVTFGTQTNDVSQGRFPDGGSSVSYMPDPSPRAGNIAPGQSSEVQILAVGMSEGGLTITWRAEPNRSYRVQFTPALTGAAWADVAEVLASGPTAAIISPINNSPQGFFRIQRGGN